MWKITPCIAGFCSQQNVWLAKSRSHKYIYIYIFHAVSTMINDPPLSTMISPLHPARFHQSPVTSPPPPSTPDVARCSAHAAAPRSRSSERSARAAWRSPPRTLGVPTVAPGAKIWSIPLIFDFPSDVGSFPGCFGWFGVEMFKNARMIEIWLFFKPNTHKKFAKSWLWQVNEWVVFSKVQSFEKIDEVVIFAHSPQSVQFI